MNNVAISKTHGVSGDLTIIYFEDEKEWFIAKEIAEKLGYGKTDKLTDLLDDDEIKSTAYGDLNKIKDLPFTPNPRGHILINESGLYHACFKSGKPEAMRFRKWVTEDVLPSIRRAGSYKLESLTRRELIERTADMCAIALQLEKEKELLQKKIDEDKPNVDFAQLVLDTNEDLTISMFAKLISDYSNKTLGSKTLYKILRELGYLIEGEGKNKRATEHNTPYQKYIDKGYFTVKYVNNNSTKPQTLITVKGQVAIILNIMGCLYGTDDWLN